MSVFKSELISPEEVIKNDLFFNIPIYQRLYVWGREQVQTLLGDIWQACEEKKDTFYLGGALVIARKNGKGESYFDLIDGQQRFTTLWLISIAWQEELQGFRFTGSDDGVKRHRIEFAIRPEVKAFFNAVLKGAENQTPQARQLDAALEEMRSFLSNKKATPEQVTELTRFIKENVQLVLTTVPENTDLNKLFEVINNRGVQLQHHEILKARLLDLMDDTIDRESYSQLWEACAYMNDYVERNLKRATGLDLLPLYVAKTERSNFNIERLVDAEYVLTKLNRQHENRNTWSLETILTSNEITLSESDTKPKFDDVDAPDRVNSIISFSMLLQHTLRIFLQDRNYPDIQKISDKDLLKIFNDCWLKDLSNSGEVKDFFELLWKVRYQFDKYIIKWILVDEDKFHGIRQLTEKGNYLQRSTENSKSDFALLQSMLYHSQEMITQYWLTPVLNYLVKHGESGCEDYLEYLDNHLLCSNNSAPLIDRTKNFLVDIWHKENLCSAEQVFGQEYENGTQYPHYWFYKLEYVLYKHLAKDSKRKAWRDNDFRMTAKNSVEHISPQSKSLVEHMHGFGNLALVTRSLNSEMSDKSFAEKRAYFKDKHHGKGVSLKLEYVYENKHWNDELIQKHEQEMTAIFQAYLDNRKNY